MATRYDVGISGEGFPVLMITDEDATPRMHILTGDVCVQLGVALIQTAAQLPAAAPSGLLVPAPRRGRRLTQGPANGGGPLLVLPAGAGADDDEEER